MKLFAAIGEAMAAGRSVALCTVVGVRGSAPRAGGARMLVYEDGSILGTIGGGAWEKRVVDEALAALADAQPRRVAVHLTHDLGMCCGGAMEAFVEPLTPLDRLHVFGAGHVAAELAPLALRLDFEVHVYDDRDEWLTAERFPGCVLHERDPRRSLPELGDRDYTVIVTHDHQLDQDLLFGLLERPGRYLGMIGSRTKVARFLVRMRAAGMDPALFDQLRAPIGLDIGGVTPAEIAVAIAAELVSVRRGVEGLAHPLSRRPSPPST